MGAEDGPDPPSGRVLEMKDGVRAVKHELSHDTIECLEHLLKAARAGEVIGLAFAALKPRRGHITHTCGLAKRERIFTRGLLRELDDDLSHQSHS